MSPTRLLRSARLAAHLSQAEVARAVGVSVKTVQRWEAGEPASRRHAEALERLLEQIEIQTAGRPLAVPPALAAEARRAHDEVMTVADKMIRSGERVPPGWRWNIYALVSFLRRASAEGGLVFAEEADTLIAEQVMLSEWRRAAIGADRYADFRGRVVRLLRQIRESSPTRGYLNGSALLAGLAALALVIGGLWPGS